MNGQSKTMLVAMLLVLAVVFIGLVGARPAGRGVQACKDGVDNDGDGLIDWPEDPGCTNKNDKSELGTVECDDGVDNDGDDAVDYNDNGCSGPTDDDETDCGDGVCEGGEVCGVCIADCGYCDTCGDTDGGFVPGVQGTVYGENSGQPYNYTDYCSSGTVLVEHFCVGASPASNE